ncbi:MAG: DUF1570 domain-containing protein [Alphaproteobacteria bacterium]|uniref:DUF1570 domain-containing protein n=1 Tax=Brevundimonas sp. TaxID=1871086 RepID=UPI003566AA7D|nr:DUF1570 domain-containing protein [Alphaproteobacteria bacterium]
MSIKSLGIGILAAIAVFLGWASSAHAEWLKAETKHFIIYGDTSEREMRAYAEKVERFDSFLRTYYPAQSEYEIPRLEIYLANGRRDMLRAEPRIGPSVGGFYSPNSGRIHAVVNTESSRGDLTLFHEYGHHFMYQMMTNAYPSWFVEGFAEYYSTADVRPDRIQFGRHDEGRMTYFVQLPANSWAPMADVLKWRISDSGRYRAGDYYAQAWGLTHYFMSTPERTRMLGLYLAAVTQGEDSVQAMERVTGRSAAQLQNDMRLYLSGAIQVHIPQVQFPTPEVKVSRLSSEQAELLWLDLRLDREPVKVEVSDPPEDETDRARQRRETLIRENAEDRAELIRAALAAHNGNGNELLRLRVVARGHRLAGNSRAGFQVLEPHLTRDQTDPDLLRLAAELLMDETGPDTEASEATGNRREAVAYLARSLDADPLNFLTYRALNEARRGEPSYPNDNDLSTLDVALKLAPQSFDIRMRLARAYMSRDMNAEAIVVLRPVANSPHGGSWSRRAKALVATAQSALGQSVDPIVQAPEDTAETEVSAD